MVYDGCDSMMGCPFCPFFWNKVHPELRGLLLARDYKSGVIENAIQKARQIPRSDALKKVVRVQNTKRPVFVISFNPRLPSLSKIVSRHWRTMRQDLYLGRVSKTPRGGGP